MHTPTSKGKGGCRRDAGARFVNLPARGCSENTTGIRLSPIRSGPSVDPYRFKPRLDPQSRSSNEKKKRLLAVTHLVGFL